MKVYEVYYRNDEDYNIHEFYTVKSTAEKRQRYLKRLEKTNDYTDDNNGVNMLYELTPFEVALTKSGVIGMLNNRFGQSE